MSFLRRVLGLSVKSAIGADGTTDAMLRTGTTPDSLNWKTALQVSTVLSCVRVISDGLSQVPFHVYREADGKRSVRRDLPLDRVLHRRPNTWQTAYEFRETMTLHTLLTGNAYAFVNRVGRDREVREIVPLDPQSVEVRRARDWTLSYVVTGFQGRTQEFPADAIWHWRGPSWDSWQGLDAVKTAAAAIGLSSEIEKSQRALQKNGAKTSGLLSMKNRVSPEKFAFLADWLKKYAPGGERSGQPMILDDDAKFSSFVMSNADAQTTEQRKFQIEEICRFFRVLPIMVGHADKTATYASAEQMFLAHVIYTLMPWYARIEQSADANLLTAEQIADGYYTKFTPNALMRGAAKDRAEFYAKALGSGGTKGWMTQNEVRDLEEMDRSADPEADKLPQMIGTATPTEGQTNGPD